VGYPPVCQRPLSSATLYKRLAHLVPHVAEACPFVCFVLYVPRFIARCVLGESQVLFCVGLASEVRGQRQTSVRKSLTIQNRTSARSSRPTFFTAPTRSPAPQRHHRLRDGNGRHTRPCRGALRIQSQSPAQNSRPTADSEFSCFEERGSLFFVFD